MRNIRTISAATIVAASLAGAPAAGAQTTEAPAVHVSPGAGPAGTAFSFSGSDCVGDPETGVILEAELLGGDAPRSFTIPVPVGPDGSWSARYVVREDDPVGTYEVQATCHLVGSEPPSLTPLFEYAPAGFEVTDGPVAPPAPVDPQDPEITAGLGAVPGTVPVASAAVAVPGRPDYTG